jgi:hypothetical protein
VRIQVEPFYGWGWSCRDGKGAAVPPPFNLDAVITETDGFKTAVGLLDQAAHPLASMWIFLSPILAGNTWNLSHLCAFTDQPSISDNEENVNALGKVIASAQISGFARVSLDKATPLDMKTCALFRPVGEAELNLIRDSGWRAFPPRLPEQPIFYPVLDEQYAIQIARDWNTRDGGKGFVLRFQVEHEYLSRYEAQTVGARNHREYWIPAGDLSEFNRHIIGIIEVIHAFGVPGG